MSRERAPVMDRVRSKVEGMKNAVLRSTPQVKGETEEVYHRRLKGTFQSALEKMARKQDEWKTGRSKYGTPHQGAKECARRVEQLKSGAIWNYVHGQQYPSY